MERRRLILLAALSALPVLMLAHKTGAPARSTGAPGDRTCSQASCHVGSEVGRLVTLTYSGGTSYIPGEKGKFTVTIGDTDTRRAYGFQASARTSENGQAGTLQEGLGTAVVCDGDRTPPCLEGAVQFITHSQPSSQPTFEFEWTPPATASGDIVVYAAANAANGNGDERGDRIHTTSLRLIPAASGTARPAITLGGIVDPWTRKAGIAPGTWVEIYGQNFATSANDWSGAIKDGILPTTLAGATVTINNKAASISLASPGQLNALVPADAGTGDGQVIVKTAAGESSPATLRLTNISPVVFAPVPKGDRFDAFLVDNTTGVLYGAPPASRSARPGDLVQLYALGLGPTNPPFVTDRTMGIATVANPVTVRFGEVSAEVLGAALISPGLYQINLRVPNISEGEHALTIEVGGQRSPGNTLILVAR